MPRKKRSSPSLEKAQRRIASFKAVNPNFDLGNSISIAAFATLIEQTRNQLETYNTALSLIDQNKNQVGELERSLSDMSERLLSGFASIYGRASDEYEMAGGSKRNRRTTRKTAPDDTSTPAKSTSTNRSTTPTPTSATSTVAA